MSKGRKSTRGRSKAPTVTPYLARRFYLSILQSHVPEFWKTLNAIWRSGCYDGLREWYRANGMSPRGWLHDVVCLTLGLWTSQPDGVEANLGGLETFEVEGKAFVRSTRAWYWEAPLPSINEPLQMTFSRCTISQAFLSVSKKQTARFKAAIIRELVEQVDRYIELARRTIGPPSILLYRDAEMTVLHFHAGKSYGELAIKYFSDTKKTDNVKKIVRNFSATCRGI